MAHSSTMTDQLEVARQVLSGYAATDLFAEEEAGLITDFQSPINRLPVASTSLQLLKIATAIAQTENFENFFNASSRLKLAFANMSKTGSYGHLTQLPVLPIRAQLNFGRALDVLFLDDAPSTVTATNRHHFAMTYWTFAARAASVDPIKCSAVTGLPDFFIENLAVTSYVNLLNFVAEMSQHFVFAENEEFVLNALDKSLRNVYGGGE